MSRGKGSKENPGLDILVLFDVVDKHSALWI